MENNQYFDENGHLNDAGVTLWVDALRLQREADLPDALQEHLELCAECRVSVFEYYEFKREDDIAELANHPYFTQLDKARANATPVVSIDKRKTAQTTQPLRKRLAVAASIVVLLVAGWWIAQNIGGNNQKKDIISNNQDTTQTPAGQKDSSKDNTEKKIANNNTTPKQDTDTPKTKEKSKKQPEKKQEEKIQEIQNNPVFSEAIAYLDNKIANKGATRGQEVPSPALDANYSNGQGILFEWKSGVADQYRLKIMTNKTQNTPKTIEINGGLSQYKLTGLKTGKYYWQLFKVTQGRSKSVGLGRFIVK